MKERKQYHKKSAKTVKTEKVRRRIEGIGIKEKIEIKKKKHTHKKEKKRKKERNKERKKRRLRKKSLTSFT